MPSLRVMLANQDAARAADAWRRISEKPTSVVFKTKTAVIGAQTVRLEYDGGVSQSESAAGVGSRRKLVIFGIRDHATLPDTNIKRGYRFVRESREYEVVSVIVQTGEIQAIAEVVG